MRWDTSMMQRMRGMSFLRKSEFLRYMIKSRKAGKTETWNWPDACSGFGNCSNPNTQECLNSAAVEELPPCVGHLGFMSSAWAVKCPFLSTIYDFWAKPERTVPLIWTACLHLNSYVGHVENDSSAACLLTERCRLYIEWQDHNK